MRSRSASTVAFATAILAVSLHTTAADALQDRSTPARRFGLALTRIDKLLIEGHPAAAESLADSIVIVTPRRTRGGAPDRYAVLDSLTHSFSRRTYPVHALRYGAPLMALAESLLVPESADMARMIRRHALLQFFALDTRRAASEGARAEALAARVPGISIQELAEFQETLAGFYSGLASYDSSGAVIERCLEIRRRVYGEVSIEVAKTMAALANASRAQGDYTTSLSIIEKAIDIAERSAPDDPVVLRLYNIQAASLAQLGDVERANRVFRMIVTAAIRIYGTQNHREVARFMNNVGLSEYDMGHHDEARRVHASALAIRRLLEDRGGVIESLRNLALVDVKTGHLTEAESLLIEVRLRDTTLTVGSAAVDGMLFRIYLATGRLAKADSVLRCEWDGRRRIQAPVHPDMIDALFSRARLQQMRGETSEAFATCIEVDSLEQLHLSLNSRSLSERQVLGYTDTRPRPRDLALSLGASKFPGASIERLWDAEIRARGQVLDEMAQRRRTVAAQSDPTLQSLATELEKAKSIYGQLLASPAPDAVHADTLDAARDRIEKLETRIAEISLPLREDQRRARLGFREVREALPVDAALVGFVEYLELRPGGAPAGTDSVPRYAAFVLSSTNREPDVVLLGAASHIDSLVTDWRREMDQHGISLGREDERRARGIGSRLRRAVWDPLRSRIADAKLVFLVPDGMLGLTNFGGLPAATTGYLIETGPLFHMLTSERDLVRESSRHINRGLLVMADPEFDVNPATLAGPTMLATAASTSSVLRGPDVECGDMAKLKFEPLPASKYEGAGIASTWRLARGTELALSVTGSEADEGTFKNRAPGHRVVHLATHGFFLDPSCGREDSLKVHSTRKNPLRLAGLAFAGANRRTEGPPGHEDGILTAEEISSVNLSGVEWVVLSACNTALGDVRVGEGLFGLRRAFAIAGAGTTIMSLWPVEDKATRQWMETLYRARILEGRSTAESVRAASRSLLKRLRERGASTHPSTWAAFIGSGDWR